MLINITCNALDGANMPGKKEAVSASAAKNAQNHMENNRYIQSELVLKQLFTYGWMQEREFHSIGTDWSQLKNELEFAFCLYKKRLSISNSFTISSKFIVYLALAISNYFYMKILY